MSKSKLSVMAVIYEALGFAFRRFGTALHVAWLPILLLLVLQAVTVRLGLAGPFDGVAATLRLEPGYIYQFAEALVWLDPLLITMMGIGVILQASFAVPLIRYAAHGTPPPHHTLHLSFSLPHLKFVTASLVSFALILIAAQMLLAIGMQWIDGSVMPILQTERTVFEPGSLHRVHTEQVFEGLNGLLAQIDMFFFRVGINLRATDTLLLAVILPLAGYIMLRLMPFPFTAAAHEQGASRTSLGYALALSGGWNIFPLLAILTLFALIHMASLALYWVALNFLSFAIVGSEVAIAGFEQLVPRSDFAPLVRGGLAMISVGLLVAFSAFVAALHAGLGGALVRRAEHV